LRPRRIEVEIDKLVVDDSAVVRTEFAAALQRELVRLVRDTGRPREHVVASPAAEVARRIHGSLSR
jgi:hypothetical protein